MMKNGWYAAGGRQRIRVRDSYVRDVVAPLLRSKADGVVKLDIVLRGLAKVDGKGDGEVPSEISWAQLHQFCRGRASYRGEIALQRKWVSDKLNQLESLQLLRRDRSSKNRPRVTVLSDRADGSPFDNPAAVGDHFVTVLGELIDFDHLGGWSTCEIAAYLAAMNAERLSRQDLALNKALGLDGLPAGGGRWYRSLSWFADPSGAHNRPEWHIRYPFSERTLRRGFRSLEGSGLVLAERITADPRDGHAFPNGPRVLYHNGFDDVRFSDEIRRQRLIERQTTARNQRAGQVDVVL